MEASFEATDIIIPFPISTTMLWGIFFIAVVVFVIMSWVLVHHWNYYGIKDNNKIFAKSLFFIGGISILLLLFLFIGSYSLF